MVTEFGLSSLPSSLSLYFVFLIMAKNSLAFYSSLKIFGFKSCAYLWVNEACDQQLSMEREFVMINGRNKNLLIVSANLLVTQIFLEPCKV